MKTENFIGIERVRLLNKGKTAGGPVVYWMTREQRVADNWSLLLAQHLALEYKKPLIAVFCLVPDYPGANIRHYGFMLKGLQEVDQKLAHQNIPFLMLQGNPPDILPRYLAKIKAAALVSDFDPLRVKKSWQQQVANKISCPFYQVDAHNIVPCWKSSPKQEYAAYTLRPKINKLLPDFLGEFPKLEKHPYRSKKGTGAPIDWQKMVDYVKNHSVAEIDWLKPGEAAAMKQAKYFLRNGLQAYTVKHNDPNQQGQSNISPYLHFGHIAPQRMALLVQGTKAGNEAKTAFLEELIIRRELADNFCHYNENYDRFEGFPGWAQKSLDVHRQDKRQYVYALEEFENSRTHDDLWNAAQRQMVVHGKMHGYLRMYWAKKILEWSEGPDEALAAAIYLNDKYELDGRDPNGYTGIVWSIGGVHDRAWQERPIFGKIRFMSYAGCARKFDVEKFVAAWSSS